MASTAEVLDLHQEVLRTVRRAVLVVERFEHVFTPLNPGDETEVWFVGKLRGEHEFGRLTAWLTDDPPGFEPEVRVTDGW
jgi:hypothetical protein